MAIRKRSVNTNIGYTDYPHLKSGFNNSNPNNPTHHVNEPHNFNLKTITLEDCDQAVFIEFNNRFLIGENYMQIILLDAELPSIREQNIKQFDKDKNFLNGPYLTMFRTASKPKYRTNPANKQAMYVVPVQKANGVVYEEYIFDGPLCYELMYEFKFITNFREFSNKFEEQFRYYFRNKRNIIIVNNERFSIGPDDFENFSQLELINRESIDQRTYYVSTYTLKLDCFIRDLSNMQKRERPNKFRIDFNVKDSGNEGVQVIDEIDISQKKITKNDP